MMMTGGDDESLVSLNKQTAELVLKIGRFSCNESILIVFRNIRFSHKAVEGNYSIQTFSFVQDALFLSLDCRLLPINQYGQ